MWLEHWFCQEILLLIPKGEQQRLNKSLNCVQYCCAYVKALRFDSLLDNDSREDT